MAKEKKKRKEKPEKQPKMRSSAPRRFGAWVFVIFMIVMILFSVYKVVTSPTERTVESALEKQVTILGKDSLARTKAVNFAERFAIEYFTYSYGDEYSSKMSSFYANGLTATSPSKQSRPEYVGASAVNVEDDKVNIDVSCRVRYMMDNEENGYDLLQVVTLRVPIKVDESGNCAVVAEPIYVDGINQSKSINTVQGIIGDDSNLADADTIKETIKNFFATYYKGTSSELKYYITKNYGDPVTIGLPIEVSRIDASITKNEDRWIAECSLSINNEGIIQSQHCFLEIVKGAEGRYYINKLFTM